MIENEAWKVLKLAFQVALAARHETILSRCPRMLKVSVATVLLGTFIFLYNILTFTPIVLTQEAMNQDAWSERVEAPKEMLLVEAKPTISHEEEGYNYRPHLAETDLEKKAVQFNNNFSENKLSVAPDRSLVDKQGPDQLPKIARDGTKPWEYYARPFDLLDPRPRIALVIVDLGLSRIATDSTIYRMPGPVTLAFDVQGKAIDQWLARARSDGHETLISVPMEPIDYPRNDPGPGSLLMSLSDHENVGRFDKFLGVGTGYVGVTSLSGTRFLSDPSKVEPVMDSLRRRGLLVLDSGTSGHSAIGELAKKKKVPFASTAIVIDKDLSPYAIEQALIRLENLALKRGQVVALASPLPLTLSRLQDWIGTLEEKGIALAPLSAVASYR